MTSFFQNKAHVLFVVLAGIFISNALLAEFIGVKIFSLEQTLGKQPLHMQFFGIHNLSFNLTTGVLIWPIVFIMTDIINEYYGPKGVRFLSYLTVGLILYAFLVVFVAIRLVPADFWPSSHLQHYGDLRLEVSNLNTAFKLIFGQGLWIIIGSITAFLIGQILDVLIFHSIKSKTGERAIWLRATGSTIISQLIDSFVVLFIAFYIGADWPMSLVLAIMVVNYMYKFSVAILLTPILYIIHHLIDRYLGESRASEMKAEAMQTKL